MDRGPQGVYSTLRFARCLTFWRSRASNSKAAGITVGRRTRCKLPTHPRETTRMRTGTWLAAGLIFCSATALAQPPAPGGDRPAAAADATPKPASSRVSAVTVYQGNALVTREVDVPAGKGLAEL